MLLGDTRPELSQSLGLVVTTLLLASSFFMNRAEVEMANGNREGFLRAIFVTLVLGTIFLVAGLLLATAFVSYRPTDPSLFYQSTELTAVPVAMLRGEPSAAVPSHQCLGRTRSWPAICGSSRLPDWSKVKVTSWSPVISTLVTWR